MTSQTLIMMLAILMLTSCIAPQPQPTTAPVSTQSPEAVSGETPQASLPNPQSSVWSRDTGPRSAPPRTAV